MELSRAQRQQRMSIRNFFLTATVEQLKIELARREERKDAVAIFSLKEMIAECEKAGVDNFGKVPS